MAYKLGLVGADQHPNRLARYQPANALHEVQDSVSYEYLFPHDQGDQDPWGACCSFAAASFLETALKKHHGVDLTISRRAIYAMAQKRFHHSWIGTDSGLYGSDVLGVLQLDGVVKDADWPYNVAKERFFDAVPQSLVQTDHRLLSFRRVTGSEDAPVTRFEKMHVALSENGCLLIGMTWPEAFFYPEGRKLPAKPAGGIAGGHEIICVASSRSRRVAVVRCAWAGYGDRGFVEIPWDVSGEFAPSDVYCALAP